MKKIQFIKEIVFMAILISGFESSLLAAKERKIPAKAVKGSGSIGSTRPFTRSMARRKACRKKLEEKEIVLQDNGIFVQTILPFCDEASVAAILSTNRSYRAIKEDEKNSHLLARPLELEALNERTLSQLNYFPRYSLTIGSFNLGVTLLVLTGDPRFLINLDLSVGSAELSDPVPPTADQLKTLLLYYPNIRVLKLSGLHRDSLIGILQVLTTNSMALKNLVSLDLSYASLLENDIIVILQHCPNLREISFSNFYNSENNNSINALVAHITNHPDLAEKLTTIDVSQYLLTSLQIAAIVASCPNIENLDVSGCRGKVALGLVLALQQNEQALCKLKKINLWDTNSSAQLISLIIRNCPLLEELELNNCKNALVGILDALRCPGMLQHLQKLDLRNANISEEDLAFIQDRLPHTEIMTKDSWF